MAIANETNTPSTNENPIAPITLRVKDTGEIWTLDFNRTAMRSILQNTDLAQTLDVSRDDIGMITRMAMWDQFMPQIMTIASRMNHIPAMSLPKAENIYRQMGSRSAEFAGKLTELYVRRVAEANGRGNEDLTEESEGNVSWE